MKNTPNRINSVAGNAIMIIGKSFYHTGDYIKAQRKFEELVNFLPNSEFVPEAKLWLGKTFIAQNNFSQAKLILNELVAQDVNERLSGEAQMLLGELYFSQEDFTAAIQEFENTVDKVGNKEDKVRAQLRIGQCYIELNDYRKAAEMFQRGLVFKPDLEQKYILELSLGQSLRNIQEFDDAIGVFEKMTKGALTNNETASIRLEIAETLIKKGEGEKATIALEDIIRDFPKTDFASQAYYKLSQLYLLEYGDFTKAYEYIDLANKEFTRSTIRDSILFWTNNLKEWDKLNFELAVYKKAFDNLVISTDDTIGNYIVEESESPEDDFEFPDFFANEDSTKTKADSLRQIAIRDSVRADSLRNLAGGQNDPRSRNQQNLNQEQAPNRRNRNLSLANNPQANAQNQKPKKVLKKVTVPKSPIKLKSNLVASGNRLAELYFLEFDFPDSALAYYDFLLNGFPEHEMNPHWLFTSAFLLSEMGFQNQADSINNYIIEVYPESDYAIQLRQQLEIEEVEHEVNPADELFNQAEKFLFEKEMVDSSIYIYQKIIDDYPKSEFAPKSLYSIAYIYDWFKNDTSQALGRYRQLVSEYPGSDYAKESQKKISAVQKFIKQAEMEKKKQTISDSMKNVQGDSVKVEEIGRPLTPSKNQFIEDEVTGEKIIRSQARADTSDMDERSIPDSLKQAKTKQQLPPKNIELLEDEVTGERINPAKMKNDTLKTGKNEKSIPDSLKTKVKKIPPPLEKKKK